MRRIRWRMHLDTTKSRFQTELSDVSALKTLMSCLRFNPFKPLVYTSMLWWLGFCDNGTKSNHRLIYLCDMPSQQLAQPKLDGNVWCGVMIFSATARSMKAEYWILDRCRLYLLLCAPLSDRAVACTSILRCMTLTSQSIASGDERINTHSTGLSERPHCRLQ